MAEGARLLSEYRITSYLGFESPALRHFQGVFVSNINIDIQSTQRAKITEKVVKADTPPSPTLNKTAGPSHKKSRQKPPLSWIHCFIYMAGALLFAATFFPWFTPTNNLIEAANQASIYAFSPLTQFLNNSSEIIVIKNHYALAEFGALSQELKKLANNPYAMNYFVSLQNNSVDTEGNHLGTPDLDNENSKVAAYIERAHLIPATSISLASSNQNGNLSTSNSLEELLSNLTGSATSTTNSTEISEVQQNILFSANMIMLTQYAWFFSIALLIIGVVLTVFRYHIRALTVVLVGGVLCGFISATWITLCSLIFVSAGFTQGVSIAPLISFLVSVAILIMLTWNSKKSLSIENSN